ncbi:hypothetical protein WN55_00318 [Dufourea novaeangliae]|uniref:Uncharacterized protein n=1 Tax=Dufourea novaeangliae TaxID=178035 RepID=A0A154PAT7_DUFNO|nr:hypothetical protein WN55_00318 [Dufourea novaeangliae]
MAVGRQGRHRVGRDTNRKLFCICTCSYTAASSPENDDSVHCFRTRNAVKLAASAGNPTAALAASAHPPVLWSSRRKPGKCIHIRSFIVTHASLSVHCQHYRTKMNVDSERLPAIKPCLSEKTHSDFCVYKV